MTGKNEQGLGPYLTRSRVVVLTAADKREALVELIDLVCDDISPSPDRQTVFEAVWRREETLPAVVMPGIAIPHARIPNMREPVIAVGRSADGIAWKTESEEELVHAVILILGPEKEHLQVLSRLATRLSNEQLYRQLLETDDPGTMYELLALPYAGPLTEPELRNLSITCFEHALAMARRAKASSLVLHADAAVDIAFVARYRFSRIRLVVVARDVSRYADYHQIRHFVAVPFHVRNRSSQVDVAFLFLLSQGILRRDDLVVSVCGAHESGLLDTIMVTSLRQEYENYFPQPDNGRLPADIEPQVLSRVLQLAMNLAGEGREGKPVGTLFVVGDYREVKKYCRQLIVNPFKGYIEADRNILDPALEETIKEFSRIDGAFVLRGDGVIISAGTYLRTDTDETQLQPGLGARHAAAAMISRQTGALSVVLSESTRKISLFQNGERTLEL